MHTSKNPISRVTGEAGELFDEFTLQPPGRPAPRGALSIDAFHGHGNANTLFVRARVRSRVRVGEAGEADSRWRNLANTVRRVTSRGSPGVQVVARFGDSQVKGETDVRGFVELEIPVTTPLDPRREWLEVALEATDPRTGRQAAATARVLVPAATAEYGVISDIDDTVVQTEVTNWLRMLRIVLLTNAYTRTPFEHVATLYRSMRDGFRGDAQNPIFYVSSSPWSFYDLLEHFFRIHGLPAGPLFLKSYRISLRHLRGSSHHSHKLTWIRVILERHPNLPFVLVGDSGQEDPEIYREVVREYPDRVLAIFIRDVTSPDRDAQVHQIAEEVRAMGVEMALVEDKIAAARTAARLCLIRDSWLHAMRDEPGDQPSADEALATGTRWGT